MTQNWNIDRTISVGLILAVLFQAGSFIWYGAKFDSRVVVLETNRQTDVQEQKAQNQAITSKMDDLSTRLARIEGILLGKPVDNGAPQ
jgi:hypothetical protein